MNQYLNLKNTKLSYLNGDTIPWVVIGSGIYWKHNIVTRDSEKLEKRPSHGIIDKRRASPVNE